MTSTKPVYGQPDYLPAATTEEIQQLAEEPWRQQHHALAGWDISMGCRINYGRDPGGELVIDLQLGPDYNDSGVVRRTITPEHLVQHARHLLRVAREEIIADKRLIAAPALCDIEAAINLCQATTQHLDMANGAAR